MAMVVSSNLLIETDKSGRVYPGNTYDYSPFNASVQAQLYNNLYGAGNCVDQIKGFAARGIDEICEAAVSLDALLLSKLTIFTQDAFYANLVESVYDNYLGRDEHDMRELKPDPFPYLFYIQYLNTPEVQAAIGAYQNYSKSNEAVSQAFTATGDDNREPSTVEALGELLRQGITVMLYAGDADYM